MPFSTVDLVEAHLLKEGSGGGFQFLEHGSADLGSAMKIVLTPQEVEELSRLISELPYAGQMRCHMPGFAVETTYKNGGFVRASFCFRCNNIIVEAPEDRYTIEFDAKSSQALELLSYLKSLRSSQENR